jgi:peptidoglycan/xylan/chitin deacetylase (PgdA/CDA1 family)
LSFGKLPILTYHALDGSGSPVSTDPAWFVDSICRLHEAGLKAVDLTEWIARGRPAIERGFAVAFDDGLRSILRAVPTLERLGVPATVFLVTDHVGKDNDWPGQPGWVPREATLDWSEILDISIRGFAFGSHTRAHPRLDRLGAEAIRRELSGSSQAIESRLNRECRLFAYPYGSVGPEARSEAGRLYDAAFGTRLDATSAADDPFQLPRIDAYYVRSDRAVNRLISGRLGASLAARRGLRMVRRAAVSLGPAGR